MENTKPREMPPYQCAQYLADLCIINDVDVEPGNDFEIWTITPEGLDLSVKEITISLNSGNQSR